jgi:drug/metabolite transporter (DMT)-like permease
MVTVGEPVGASILAWILLGETVPPPAILGSALTLSGVAWALRDRSPDRANAQAAR